MAILTVLAVGSILAVFAIFACGFAKAEPVEEDEEAPETEASYTYTFEKQKSVFLTTVLKKAGVPVAGKPRAVASSDPEALRVRGPYAVST